MARSSAHSSARQECGSSDADDGSDDYIIIISVARQLGAALMAIVCAPSFGNELSGWSQTKREENMFCNAHLVPDYEIFNLSKFQFRYDH